MPPDWLHPALRFAQYAVLRSLFGTVAFYAFNLRQLVSDPSFVCFRAVVTAAIAAPVILLAVVLVGIAAIMGQPLQDLEWTTVNSMVAMTDIGRAFLVRMSLLMSGTAVLLLIKLITLRHMLEAFFYGLALWTLAWTGHAAATDGALGLVHRLNDGLHLLAARFWLGAIGWFTILVLAAHKNPDLSKSGYLREAMEAFAPLGITLVAIVAVTGVVNAHVIFGLENSMAVLGTN